MSKRTKIAIVVLSLLALSLIVLRLNPRIPLSNSTIIQKASAKGFYYVVAVQLSLGVNPDGVNRTPLIESIYNNHPDIARLLVSHGASIERQWASGEPNGPPLAWALMYGRRDIAKMLLRHGARADYKPRYGANTALHMAVELNDTDLVKLLLQNGADPNSRDQSSVTALMLAKAYKRLKIEDILHHAGAKSSPNTFSGTPARYCFFMKNRIAPPKMP